MVSKKFLKKAEGAVDVVGGVVSMHPVGDAILRGKKTGEGLYKLYTGRDPPYRRGWKDLSVGEKIDRLEARRERARDRWMSRHD